MRTATFEKAGSRFQTLHDKEEWYRSAAAPKGQGVRHTAEPPDARHHVGVEAPDAQVGEDRGDQLLHSPRVADGGDLDIEVGQEQPVVAARIVVGLEDTMFALRLPAARVSAIGQWLRTAFQPVWSPEESPVS